MQALHARVDDLRLGGEERDELPPEQQQPAAQLRRPTPAAVGTG